MKPSELKSKFCPLVSGPCVGESCAMWREGWTATTGHVDNYRTAQEGVEVMEIEGNAAHLKLIDVWCGVGGAPLKNTVQW
jgi:hypothetical protein